MANNVRAIPEGYHSITPALTCRDAAKAIDFYKKALGAKEIHRMQGPDGKIGHAEMQIGDSKFMLSDEFPSMASAPDPNSKVGAIQLSIHLHRAMWTLRSTKRFPRVARSPCRCRINSGAIAIGRLADPFGHHWGLAQHVEDVAPAEMERRAKEWQEKMAKSAGGHN